MVYVFAKNVEFYSGCGGESTGRFFYLFSGHNKTGKGRSALFATHSNHIERMFRIVGGIPIFWKPRSHSTLPLAVQAASYTSSLRLHTLVAYGRIHE